MANAVVPDVDVVVVGAGFGGLRALHTLRGSGLSVVVLEASSDVGGVWHSNRYPGARCDVESYDYSYMFSPELEQEWRWTERYATQPEVLRYLHHVADRFDLRRDIELDTRMASAAYDEGAARWDVRAEDGRGWRARYLILAMGQLSATKRPDYPGTEEFAGAIFHSAEWPTEPVQLAGKRVGVIGTGSSGVQMIPILARSVGELFVFQRTANFSIPAANTPISDAEDAAIKAGYRQRRQLALNSPSGLGFMPGKVSAMEVTQAERTAAYEAAWRRRGFGFALTYFDVLLDEHSNDTAADFIRGKIAELVRDPVLRERLTPRGFPFGARRPSVDSQYFQTFNRDNVTLVDLRADPIERFDADGVRTRSTHIALDVVIFATGFDVFTGALLKPRITGRGGVTLAAKWGAGPVTYLGLGTAGFPNMFILAGPGSPSLLSNVVLSLEQQVDWLQRLIAHADGRGAEAIEVRAAAEAAWVAHVYERSRETLYARADSYYMGAEVAGKPRVFMPYSGGVRGYRRTLEQVADADYDGFSIGAGPG